MLKSQSINTKTPWAQTKDRELELTEKWLENAIEVIIMLRSDNTLTLPSQYIEECALETQKASDQKLAEFDQKAKLVEYRKVKTKEKLAETKLLKRMLGKELRLIESTIFLKYLRKLYKNKSQSTNLPENLPNKAELALAQKYFENTLAITRILKSDKKPTLTPEDREEYKSELKKEFDKKSVETRQELIAIKCQKIKFREKLTKLEEFVRTNRLNTHLLHTTIQLKHLRNSYLDQANK